MDALILSRLSYIPFEGIVTRNPFHEITIREAADIFFSLEGQAYEVYIPLDADLLRALAESKRFKDMSLSEYVNEVDFESQKQFAAIKHS